MATAAAAAAKPKEFTFAWEGKDKAGKTVRGELRAAIENIAQAQLRRQGVNVSKVKKQKSPSGGSVGEKDVALFTRQMATMMKAGVPLLQAFDIVGKGATNPAVAKLLGDIKMEVETGSSLAQAFRKYPLYFDALYCNLVHAGEQASILETLLDRLAVYKEKTLAIKAQIKSALFYMVSIIVVAIVITAVIMIFVIPAFKSVFSSFGANLPAPTLVVMGISDWTVANWYIVFPPMVIQMCLIGEETGALDAMLGTVADFFEAEVDEAVEALSSLMDPIIMAVLGTLIGGMVVAMYLPIFKLGAAV